MERLENILKNGRKLLAGAGLISLLGMPAVIGCETESDDPSNDNYSSGSNNSSSSTNNQKYNCNCEGNGLFVGIEIYGASSKSSAEGLATQKCNEEYPGRGCSCSCSNASSSSGKSSSSGSSSYPSCSSVPPDYKGVCTNNNW
ncbi:hypothetical protein HYX14_02975 [Candidatus Woesearchaeota archaeon]|nr:hypothetical protein [Candidatus Woesearchaeota archaeon]